MAQGGSSLSKQQLALVLRRASELERKRRAERDGDDSDGAGASALTEQELREIMAEVGLPAEDVERALGELRVGLLGQAPVKPTLVDRLVGPEVAVVERVVRGDVQEAELFVDEFMRSQQHEIRRDRGERKLWGPAPGLLAGVRRALDFSGRIGLPRDVEIESTVVAAPGQPGKVLVRLELRAGAIRSQRLRRIAGVVVAGAAIAVAGVVAASGAAEMVTIAAGAGAAGAGYAQVRAGYQRTVASASQTLARFLDRLEHGG